MIDVRGTSQSQEAARRIAERTTTTHTPTSKMGKRYTMSQASYEGLCQQRDIDAATIAELVAALRQCVGALRNFDHVPSCGFAIEAARAALAKVA